MRPGILALVTLIALPSLGYGQSRYGHSPAGYSFPGVPAPRDPPPHFTIAQRGSLLPRIGVPLPSHGLRPWPRPPARAQRLGNIGYVPWPMMVFYVPQPIVAPAPPPPVLRKRVERPVPGRLVLDLSPTTAQVYVDGYYAGAPEDFGLARGGGLLAAGPHRVDISAAGYEPIAVDLMVTPGQPVTYRASLKGLPPPSTVAPTTFYLIPGCYMGNIPPEDAHLPAACDQSRAVTWRP